MITVVVVVLVLLLLLGLGAVVADRVCVELAERRASEYLSEPFGRPPTVRVHGRPFLTQALRGRYRDIEVSGDGLRLGELSGATLTAHIYDAHLPPRELLGGRTTSLPCAHVTGQIVLPYSEVARISRIPGLTFSYEKRRLVATAALPVPGVSQLARVSGEARLTVVGGRSGCGCAASRWPASAPPIFVNNFFPVFMCDPALDAAVRPAPRGAETRGVRSPRVRLGRRRRLHRRVLIPDGGTDVSRGGGRE